MANKSSESYFSTSESSSEVCANTSHLTKMDRSELMRNMGATLSCEERRERRLAKRNLLHDQFRPSTSIIGEEMDFDENPRCIQERHNQKKCEKQPSKVLYSSDSEESDVPPRPSIPVEGNMSYAEFKGRARSKIFAVLLSRGGSLAVYEKMILYLNTRNEQSESRIHEIYKKFNQYRKNKLNKQPVTKDDVEALGKDVQSCRL